MTILQFPLHERRTARPRRPDVRTPPARAVRLAPWRSEADGPVLIAVDSRGHLCASIELRHESQIARAASYLWDLLDLIDPEEPE